MLRNGWVRTSSCFLCTRTRFTTSLERLWGRMPGTGTSLSSAAWSLARFLRAASSSSSSSSLSSAGRDRFLVAFGLSRTTSANSPSFSFCEGVGERAQGGDEETGRPQPRCNHRRPQSHDRVRDLALTLKSTAWA